jgi:hypothetical protein
LTSFLFSVDLTGGGREISGSINSRGISEDSCLTLNVDVEEFFKCKQQVSSQFEKPLITVFKTCKNAGVFKNKNYSL